MDEAVADTRCPWCSHLVDEGVTACDVCGATWGPATPVDRQRGAGWRAVLIAAICILPIALYFNWSSQAMHFRDDCHAGSLSGDSAMTAAERSAEVRWVIGESGPRFTCKAVDRNGKVVARVSSWVVGL